MIQNTERITYPDPDPDAVNPSEKSTQLVRESSGGSSSLKKATPGESGMKEMPETVRDVGDDNECSTDYPAKLVGPDASSEKEVARLEHERIADLERRLSERDRHILQLTEQLTKKTVLLEQAEANTAEVEMRAGTKLHELQARIDELMLSRNDHLRTLEQAQSALQKATSRAAEADERSHRELAEVHAKLEARESELAAVRLRLTDAEDGLVKSKAEPDRLRAGTQAAAGLVNMDADRVMSMLMERVRSVEAEMASLRGNEKSIQEMECRNEPER